MSISTKAWISGVAASVRDRHATDPSAEDYLQRARSQLALGQQQAALESCEQALNSGPGTSSGWLELGQILLELGIPARAIGCFEQTLSRQPDLTAARRKLAYACQAAGDLARAAAEYRELMRQNPEDFSVRLELAGVLKLQGDFGQALALLEQLLQERPRAYEALTAKASLLERMGEHEAAYRLLKPLPELKEPVVANTFAKLCLRLKRPYEAIPLLWRLLNAKTALHPRLRQPLCFRLGELYDQAGEAAKAWHWFEQANAAKPGHFDLAGHLALLDDIRHSFDRPLLAQLGPGSDSQRMVFIVGMNRSGTTLTEQILSSHPDIYGAGELDLMRQLWHRLTAGGAVTPARLAALPPAAWREAAQDYLHQVEAQAPAALRICDKMPSNFLYLGLIQALFPNAVVVHCLRHPLDTCLSCFTHDFSEVGSFTQDLVTLGEYYAGYLQLMRHWQNTLSLPMLTMRYEELIAQPEIHSRRLLSHVGLDWHPRCLAFHGNRRFVASASYDQVRRPLYSSSVGRYQAYRPFLARLEAILGAEIAAYEQALQS